MSMQQRLAEGRPSVTATGAASHRAVHQVADRPLVFVDPLAEGILGAEGRAQAEPRFRNPAESAPMRAVMVARHRYAEDALAASGAGQYVLLGAGLDTFAYRQADAKLRVFEVDHPATQGWKQARLAEMGVKPPKNVTYAPIDFARDAIADALKRAGFEAKKPAFCAWLGVLVYLDKAAIETTLAWAATLAPGSEIVFDFSAPRADLEDTLAAQRAASVGEPWKSFYTGDEMTALLRAKGFKQIEIIGPDALNARYFAQSAPDLRVRRAMIAHART